eukprot:5211203-Lingulodinium_polyedra.AAC.1
MFTLGRARAGAQEGARNSGKAAVAAAYVERGREGCRPKTHSGHWWFRRNIQADHQTRVAQAL